MGRCADASAARTDHGPVMHDESLPMPLIAIPSRHRVRWCQTPLAAARLAAVAPHAGAQTATPAAPTAAPATLAIPASTPPTQPAAADTPANRIVITGNPLGSDNLAQPSALLTPPAPSCW